MSVEVKATIYKGYELAEGWNEIVDEDFFEEYVDYFVDADAVRGNGPQLFAVEVDSVEEGCFTEYSTYISTEEENLLSEFATKYPGAVVYDCPAMYLVGKVG